MSRPASNIVASAGVDEALAAAAHMLLQAVGGPAPDAYEEMGSFSGERIET